MSDSRERRRKDTPVSSFGSRLQRFRKDKGFSAEELAQLVNKRWGEKTTSRNVITSIETERKLDNITFAETIRFAQVLEISPLQLFIDMDQPFLQADFPCFQGMTNYQAMKVITPYIVNLPQPPIGDFKDFNVWNTTEKMATDYKSIKWRLNELEQSKVDPSYAKPDDKGFYYAHLEGGFQKVFRLTSFVDHLHEEWESFNNCKEILKANKVILPKNLHEFDEMYDTENLKSIMHRIDSYSSLMSSYVRTGWDANYLE